MENLHDPTLWGKILAHRSPEIWAALLGGAWYVYQKSSGKDQLQRVSEAGISVLVGYSMGMDAAQYASVSPEIASFLITAVGYLFLDGVRAIIADRVELKKIIVRILGGNNDAK